jgi:hypothetical protein
MITYAPAMEQNLRDPNWRMRAREATAAQRVAPRPAMAPLGARQMAALAGPQPRPAMAPLGARQMVALAGPARMAAPAISAMGLPAQALLGMGMAGWEYGAPKQGMTQADYTYDAMGNITGLADTMPSPQQTALMPDAPQPMGYTGDVGMMARHAMPMQRPTYSPALMAQIAQRRAALESAAITDQLNRESQIRETVSPMSVDPRLDSNYNPDEYYGY